MRLSAMALAFVVGCAPGLAPAVEKQKGEGSVQALLQQEFDAPKAAVFSSVMDVLQDLGYTVDTADLTAGIVTGGRPAVDAMRVQEAVDDLGTPATIRAVAFVEQVPGGVIRVRLNFVLQQDAGRRGGSPRQETLIHDPALYGRVVERLSQALLLRKAAKAPPEGSDSEAFFLRGEVREPR